MKEPAMKEGTKAAPLDFFDAIKRLDAPRFDRLAKAVDGERKRRANSGARAGQMTDREFRAWADEQIKLGEQAESEKKLRAQLSGNSNAIKSKGNDDE